MNIALSYDITDTWDIGIIFVYATGNAVTVGSQGYGVSNFFGNGNFNTLINYTSLNGYRMPAYHRMDIGLTWYMKDKKKFEHNLDFSIYNVYARENAYTITFEEDPDDASKTVAIQTTLFKLIPSITYNFNLK